MESWRWEVGGGGSKVGGGKWAVGNQRSEVGGGSLADQRIASFAVRISGVQPDKFVKSLRTGEAVILGRIEDGAILLDLRSVRPHDDTILVEEIQRVVREPRRTDE